MHGKVMYIKKDFLTVICSDESRATLVEPDYRTSDWIQQWNIQSIRLRKQKWGVMLWTITVGSKVIGPSKFDDSININTKSTVLI